MMGVSSSSENEDDDLGEYAWTSSSSSSDSSSTTDNKSFVTYDVVDEDAALEAVASRSTDVKADIESITDLRVLFNDSLLKDLGSVTTKDDIKPNVLQQNRMRILSWLNDLNAPLSESVITQDMFCDFLAAKGVNREEAVEVFNRFDTDGSGKADADLVHEGVQHPYEETEDGELTYRTRVLQSCSSLPGFVDVFSKTDSSSRHASKLLSFLLRNRASASSFRMPMLAGFEDSIQLRHHVGNQILTRLEKEMKGGEEMKLMYGEHLSDVKCTGKPYSSIEVSSNTVDVHKLTDGNTGTYWQSDGAARSHWIRFNMKKNVVVKQLFIHVGSSDQSYVPQELVVSVGRKHSLKEIKEVKVPASMTGPVLIVENLKVYYPVVQLNIRRCHSDGCDTRIRLVKISGLRLVKEAGMSVKDASVRWFFQLTTCTALHCAQTMPAYRQLVIEQAREAFRYIPPMSLCHGSSDRPKFLSQPVMSQIKSFLDQVTRDSSADQVDEGVLCRIMYGLACCDLAMILSVVSYLLDNPEKTIEADTLLTSMESVKARFWARGEKLLPLVFLDCDGGERQAEGSGYIQPKELIYYDPSNISEDAYTTKKGRTKFTLIVDASESVQLTRVKIRPHKGGKGVKCGMVFLLPASDVISSKKPGEEKSDSLASSKTKSILSADDQKALYKRLEKYDDWTATDYEAYVKRGVQSDGILTFFDSAEDPSDWDEFDLPVSSKLIGRIIVFKFFRPRSDQSDTVGVVGVNVFGYNRTSDYYLEVDSPPLTSPVRGSDFVGCILSFLIAIIKSFENRQSTSSKLTCVDFSKLTVPLVIDLFNKACRLGTSLTMRKVLRLCHSICLNWAPGKDETDSSLLFETFSSFINNPADFDNAVVAIARTVIVDGAKAFFPNDQTRREQLLRMLKDINRADETISTSLVFESLCQFFSNVEPSALLNLPRPAEVIKSSDALQAINSSCFDVMDTLIHVTLYKSYISNSQQISPSKSSSAAQSTLSSGVAHSVLLKLLSCLQTSFLAWINAMRRSSNEDLVAKAKTLLLSYLSMLVGHFVKFTHMFMTLPDSRLSALFSTQDEFVFSTVQQMVVFLSDYCKANFSTTHNIDVLETLWPFVERLKTLRERLPTFFLPLDSDHWNKVQEGWEVLNTWTEESLHNYPNNQNVTRVFNCPGAKVFILEFDPRCHTERKYDYLEFSNFTGVSHKYDQKVGTDSWPLKVEMKGSKLQFTFHSDQSNNEWGYKFTVTAKGVADVVINPLFDLHLSVALLVGQMCGQTISTQSAINSAALLTVEEENKQAMLKSSLWKTLFRAGYQPADKLERSLSGRFMHGCFDNVKGFFLELLNAPTSPPYSTLIKHLQTRCKHYQELGSAEITSAVLHTFAALVYHTSDVCESISDYIKNGQDESLLVEGVYQAYNLAEQLRLSLIHLRQKFMEKGDSNHFSLAKEMVDKANLLLKFAALTKAPTLDRSHKLTKSRKGSARKATSHDLLKRLEGSIPERYGQFRLVLEFIVEPSWNCQMVESVIQERVKKSKCLCTSYQLICDYLTPTSDAGLLQVEVVVFLRAILASPKSFPSHYADAIDGCGLEQETRLRQRFYSLIKLLVRCVTSLPAKDNSRNVDGARLVIQTCLLYLLAVDWRENDLSFLKEISLPKLLFDASKDNVAVRERVTETTDEKEEMDTYQRDKNFYNECSHESFSKWYAKNSTANNKNKDVQMFIARHCDLLDVEIYCDGCKQTMPGRRYRCLDCIDMDLCVTCFTGGVNPGGNHTGDHSFVYFMYKCDVCQAFISGERVHCKVCDDFDLCYGCHKTAKTLPGHSADHEVVKYPQTRLKSACDSNKLASYIHQHAWLQFSQLTLAMAGTVFENSDARVNEDYTDMAGQLLTQCLALVTDCLQKVSAVHSKDLPTSYREEAFVQHSQERIMGLLGSIISLDEQYDAELNTMLTAVDFLKFIFYIASGQGGYGHHSTVQHLALGLLSQLMQKSTISTQVTDEAVMRTQRKPLNELNSQESGLATIEFLVQATSSCLQRQQGVDWSYSLIRLLQQLMHTDHWSTVMTKFTKRSISASTGANIDLVLVLFILTDFPHVKSPGVPVLYLDYASDERKAVILKHFPDRMQSMVIDTQTRKRRMVKDHLIERSSSSTPVYDEEMMSLITSLILDNSAKLMKDACDSKERATLLGNERELTFGGTESAQRAGAWLDIETHWVLSLCLKAFNQFVNKLVPYERLDLIRALVNLAGMGTRLSKLWLIPDLELVSLLMYVKLGNDATGAAAKAVKPFESETKSSEVSSSEGAFDYSVLFPDMDSDSRKHFTVLLEMMNLPATQLKQVYHDYKESPVSLMQALQGLFMDDNGEKLKRPPKLTPTADDGLPTEQSIDFGILPIAALPSPVTDNLDDLEAAPEEKKNAKNTKKLLSNLADSEKKKLSTQSAKLLKLELGNLQRKHPSHVHLNKVNLALSILYARQALGTVLANWSTDGPRINADLLNCEEHNIALVLDLLIRDTTASPAQFEKIVSKVMSCCKPDYLQSIADAASFFMEDKKEGSAVRESPHQKGKKVKGKVHIKGASVLSVTFASCCHTSNESSLDLSTSVDMKKNVHKFSGPKERWRDIELPGDTVYFSYHPAASGPCRWKFTVKSAPNSASGSFFTGYVILNHVLSTPSYCRAIDADTLWKRLVVVACKRTSDQRLKAIQLLLYLLQSFTKREDNADGPPQLSMDLKCLAPLWKLYSSLSENHGHEETSPVLRALTELFFVAENVATQWGMDGEFLSAVIDPAVVLPSVLEGLRRVVTISTAIGLDTGLIAVEP